MSEDPVRRREVLQAGLIKEVSREGRGENLRVNDQVTVHCTGMLDGPEKRIFWRYGEYDIALITDLSSQNVYCVVCVCIVLCVCVCVHVLCVCVCVCVCVLCVCVHVFNYNKIMP